MLKCFIMMNNNDILKRSFRFWKAFHKKIGQINKESKMSEENKTKNVKKKIWIILIVMLIFLASCSALVFKSAGFQRFKKNVKSEYSGGIKREIIIYNAEGKEIFKKEGKFDFTYDDKCIEYIDTQTNLKHNVFAGDNSTVIINELK